jgi:Type ISP C-terminal specificity domain
MVLSAVKKMLPRIPKASNAQDFHAFAQAGRDLDDLHVGYETVEPYLLEETVKSTLGASGHRQAAAASSVSYRYNVARLTPRYFAMSLPVWPSASIRLAAAVCSGVLARQSCTSG